MSALAIPHPTLPKRIIAGVDASKSSDEAVRVAHALGARLGVSVELVHALPLPDYGRIGFDRDRSEEIARRVNARAQAELDAHARALVPPSIATARTGQGLVRLVVGRAADVLPAEARASDALLVVGSHGRRGLFDLGNTVRSVLTRTSVPVWVQRGSARAVQDILAPIDPSAESSRALAYACVLAKRLGARVRAFHCFDAIGWAAGGWMGAGADSVIHEVRDAERAALEASLRDFDWSGAQHSFEFLDAEPVAQILEMSRSADLIVLGTHGTGGLVAVLGSVAHGVVRGAHCSVIAVPNPATSRPA